MRQVTLVAWYGEKEKRLAELITQCQRIVAARTNASTPYALEQVHATILGLERQVGTRGLNEHFARHRKRQVEMDFEGLLAWLRGGGGFPFEVQVGGFAPDAAPFTSRNTVPYERSFSIQGDKVVMMGWPLSTGQGKIEYRPTLDRLRRGAQSFGVLHAFHAQPADVDNDLFFRIGLMDAGALPAPDALAAVQVEVRQFLAVQPPLIVAVHLADVFIAVYEDNRLPLSSTKVYSLANPRVTGEFVRALFG